MTHPLRIDSISPVIGDLLRRASQSKCRAATYLACEAAVGAAAVRDEAVLRGLDVLRAGTSSTSVLVEEIERVVTHHDEEYFRQDEEGVQGDSLEHFASARAAKAVAFALADDPKQWREAIYEALISLADPVGLAREIEEALR